MEGRDLLMGALLAIDTSAGTSVALFRDGKLVAEKNIADNMKPVSYTHLTLPTTSRV